VARELGFEEYLMMSRGEATSGGRARQLILANSFEAVVGAIYLDQGYAVSQKFITENLIKNLPQIIEEKLYIDPKSNFQELAQEKEGITPRYDVVAEEGPDHDKTFTVVVKVGEKEWGTGTGSSKQLAQQSAAEDALDKYQNTDSK
jgi:ribonuclease-3